MHAIGIYGGTFDPIHYGHLTFARTLRDVLALPEVRLIPTGVPPHRAAPAASPQQRFAWVEQAIANEPNLIADDREVRRNGHCYTVDTLKEIQAEQPHTLLVWLIGSDAFANLTRWRQWHTLLELGHLVVIPRPADDLTALPIEIAEELAKRRVPAQPESLASGKISLLSGPLLTVSSTLIRDKLARGEDVSTLTPVANALMQSGLYRF